MQCTFCEVNKEKSRKREQEKKTQLKIAFCDLNFLDPQYVILEEGKRVKKKGKEKRNLALKDFTSTKVQSNQKNK